MDTTDGHDQAARAGMGAQAARLAPARLVVGLAQGLALYGLYWSAQARAWPSTEGALFGPMLLVALFLPVVVLGGLGRMRLRTLAIWTVGAGLILGLMGWHSVDRQAGVMAPPYLDAPVFPFAAAALFILHHLIAPADQARRRIAPYPMYFDVAWKAGVQLALSVGFTGAMWILLMLGAALFGLIGIKAFGELLAEPWFNMPVTTMAFALAVQLTDVKDGLIRGVRSVALMLLSWLLPVIAALTAAFLAALPFTGLEGLFAQGSATAMMLAAAAALIVLINAAYQDGTAATRPPAVLRWAAVLGGLLLVPLIAVAAWGLGLRIGQHGLTPDRITAAAFVVVGAFYAVGYAWAAVESARCKGWMARLEPTNVVTGLVAAVLIVLLFSPVLDPARLSVADQTARLARGAVSADRFDYAFLRFESGRVGEAALARLARSSNADVAARAKAAQAADNAYDLRRRTRRDEPLKLTAWPAGAGIPEGLAAALKDEDGLWACRNDDCLVEARDLNGDGRDEALVATRVALSLFARDDAGRWSRQGRWLVQSCGRDRGDARDSLRAGALKPQASPWPDLTIGGRLQPLQREAPPCPTEPAR